MINVKGEIVIKDRWQFRVIKVEPNEKYEYTPYGTAYVMMRNGTFESDYTTIYKRCASIQTSNSFTIKCDENASAAIIDFPGLRFLESRYYIQEELDMGNLSYMDGGTNTTATNPGRLGDPVVNYVHFPANMFQTLHTHPSHRLGLILKGNGKIELNNQKFFDVNEGELFYMRRNELHNFITNDEPVVLFVFAPDSGTGPTDEINPLKIRTFVGQQRNVR